MSNFKLIEGDVFLYDGYGNPINSYDDGDSVRRLETRTKILGENDLYMASVVQDGSVYRLAVDIPSSTTSSLTTFVDQLKNAGSPNMNVDGSVTPAIFTITADATRDISPTLLNLDFSTGNFDWNGNGFGDGNALANGILLQMTVNNGTVITLATIKINEDLTRLSQIPFVTQAGATDHMISAFYFSGTIKLKAGTADNIKATVRDNLVLAARDVKHLSATLHGNLVS